MPGCNCLWNSRSHKMNKDLKGAQSSLSKSISCKHALVSPKCSFGSSARSNGSRVTPSPIMFPSSRKLMLLLLSFVARIRFVLSSGCYYADNSTIMSSPDYVYPCGDVTSSTSPVLNCCALQSNNVCLSNSLCYDPNQMGGAYYLSPCTDKTYSAPECPQYCSKSCASYT